MQLGRRSTWWRGAKDAAGRDPLGKAGEPAAEVLGGLHELGPEYGPTASHSP